MLHFLVDVVSAILVLTGASSPEELGESEMERFQHYAEHPLRINQAGRSRLLSSGLFSAYQVASLEDYRSRSGDILGVTELGLVDGFGGETAEALSLFVSFESSLAPGALEDRWRIYRRQRLAVYLARASGSRRIDGGYGRPGGLCGQAGHPLCP